MDINKVNFEGLYQQAKTRKRGFFDGIRFWISDHWGQSGKAEIVAKELFKEMNDFKPNEDETTAQFIDKCASIASSARLDEISSRVAREIQIKLNDLNLIVKPYLDKKEILQNKMNDRSKLIEEKVQIHMKKSQHIFQKKPPMRSLR